MIPSSLIGLPYIVSRNALVSIWVFPKDRFIEYERSDEELARRYGFGHEKQVPGCFQVGNMLVMHPDYLEALKKECGQS